MPRPLESTVLFLAFLFMSSTAAQHAAAPATASLRDLLVTQFGFTDAQVAAVRRGEAVAIPWRSSVSREIAVVGAVHIDAPAAALVDVIEDIESLEKGEGFLGTKRLSDPPRGEDFAGFSLPRDDIESLSRCRPGKCDVKLGKGAFDVLATVNWRAPDVADRVNQLARQMALDYVNAYRRGGDDELAVYVDSDRPLFIAREFADMVRRADVLTRGLPELSTYLVEFPKARPQGATDFFYWSLAAFGLKPVFRLNHVVIYPTGRPTGLLYAIATKQLYASHYFHTALEVRAAIDDAARPGKAHYLVTLNLARSDGLTGLFGGIVKSKARNGSRDGLRAALAATKRLCERRSVRP